jgi:tripartite-type tricarboxylate transporter receptor subunit TctC
MSLAKLAITAVALCVIGLPPLAGAQPAPKDYPNKPIRVIVPSPPGGPPDVIFRALAPKLSAALGEPVIVENRPGGGGLVGTAYVAKQPPDGYTWLFTTASHTNIPPFNDNVAYDPVRDFTHVTLAAQNFGQVLVIHPSVPAKNLEEFIALAKKEPGKLTYGHAGIGTASHIPAEIMKSMTGTDILPVPYRGVAEALADVLAGRVDMFMVGTHVAMHHVQAGKLRALAITAAKRWKGMPEVPTMQELELKDFVSINWFGLWLPARASPRIVARMYAEMAKALNEPDIKQQFDALGLEGVAMKPEEFAKFVAKEAAITLGVARRLGPAQK